MKPIIPLLACAAFVLAPAPLRAADSKRTAEYLLISPLDHENQKVTVDVAFVKPVNWVSRIPGMSFFHARTIDRVDHKPGGEILVAVPTADAEKFARKYGTDFEGRMDRNALDGQFIAGGGRGRGKIWMIDLSGQLAEMIAAQKAEFPDEAFMVGGPGGRGPGMGEGMRPRPHGPGNAQ